jgi:hypothetical protein
MTTFEIMYVGLWLEERCVIVEICQMPHGLTRTVECPVLGREITRCLEELYSSAPDDKSGVATVEGPFSCSFSESRRLMYGCLSAITRAFRDGTHPPEYALISWHYHACSFLSTAGNSDELAGLNDAIRDLFREIDLYWVINWMTEALIWAGVPYVRGELPSTQVRKRCMIPTLHC